MSEIKQVRWSGFGGQGVVLAGLLLGEAGAIDGKFICGSNSYGAQARGSGCKAEIVFSDSPIDFPHLTMADILVAMSQGSYNMFFQNVRESSGIILYDKGQVMPREDINVSQIGVAATEAALQRLDNKQVVNIVLLGALLEITQVVSSKAIRKAINAHVNKQFRALNLKALQVGMELGRRAHG